MHWFGVMQSTADWQGNAHLPYCMLQWCVPHGTSFWHWNAMGPGTAIVPEAAGAAGPGIGAAVGWGAVGYAPGAAAGG
jgi:hypothetical protein